MYFRARYYSGELGRFVGRDPFGTINHLGLKGKHFGDLPAGLYYTNGYSLYRAYFVPNSSDYTGMYDPNKMQFCLDFLEGFFVPGPPPPTPGGVAGGASSQALDALINIENTPTEPKPGDWGGGLCNTNVDNTRKFGTKNTCKNHCTDPITCDVWDVPGEYIEVWKCQPSIIGRGGGCWAKVAEFQKCDLCI
jgi:hypothetical protein